MDERTGGEFGGRSGVLGAASRIDAGSKTAEHLALRKHDSLCRALIGVIGTHSLVLGVLMLCAPRFMLQAFGFPDTVPIFFPSQSGIFLVILGICYLLALAEPMFVITILLSKAFAVVFLFTHAAFLSAPRIVWGMGAGDATMLITLGAALFRHHRRTAALRHSLH